METESLVEQGRTFRVACREPRGRSGLAAARTVVDAERASGDVERPLHVVTITRGGFCAIAFAEIRKPGALARDERRSVNLGKEGLRWRADESCAEGSGAEDVIRRSVTRAKLGLSSRRDGCTHRGSPRAAAVLRRRIRSPASRHTPWTSSRRADVEAWTEGRGSADRAKRRMRRYRC